MMLGNSGDAVVMKGALEHFRLAIRSVQIPPWQAAAVHFRQCAALHLSAAVDRR